MTFSTDRQTFRELVALVAEKARARLPQAVNGRVESAVKLVLLHDVMPQDDGSILVGSSTDALKSYLLTGQSCECQDFVHGQAPDGWCQHRIAAGIYKRVGELLPPEPAPVVPDMIEPWPDNDVDPEERWELGPGDITLTDTAPLPEAPCSLNCHITIAGRQVQVTLRGQDELAVLTRLEALFARYPLAQPAVQATSQPQRQGKDVCTVHNVTMRWNEGKDGRKGWYSHRTDDGWCKGK